MASIDVLLEPRYLTGVVQERSPISTDESSKYIGGRLFPQENYPETTIVWDSVKGPENRLAGVFAERGRAVPGDDLSFTTYFEKMIWIQAAKYLDTDTLMHLRDPGMLALYKNSDSPKVIKNKAQRIQNKIKEYLVFIDNQIRAQKEYFAIKAALGELRWPPLGADGMPISSVMPEWNAEGGNMTIEFPKYSKFFQNVWELEGTPLREGLDNRSGDGKKWTDEDVDIRLHLEIIAEMMYDLRGIDPTNATMYLSRKILNRIAFSAGVERWLGVPSTGAVNNNSYGYADVNRVKESIKSMFGWTIESYDAMWTYISGTEDDGTEAIKPVRFLPENKVLIVPNAPIGEMAHAQHETQEGNWIHGPAVHMKRADMPPYDYEMIEDDICWPVIKYPDSRGVFTVF